MNGTNDRSKTGSTHGRESDEALRYLLMRLLADGGEEPPGIETLQEHSTIELFKIAQARMTGDRAKSLVFLIELCEFAVYQTRARDIRIKEFELALEAERTRYAELTELFARQGAEAGMLRHALEKLRPKFARLSDFLVGADLGHRFIDFVAAGILTVDDARRAARRRKRGGLDAVRLDEKELNLLLNNLFPSRIR